MDIVDIDKVLDDLELNEDQHFRTIRNNISDTTATVPPSVVNNVHHEHQNSSSKFQRQTHPNQDVLLQQQKPNGTQPMVPSPSSSSSHTTKSPHFSGQSADLSMEPSSGYVAPMQQQPPPLNRMTKTNYVNVSNVFLSLNEYMNAGVEAVKIAVAPSQSLENTSADAVSIDEIVIEEIEIRDTIGETHVTDEQVTLSQTQQEIDSASTSTSSSPSSSGLLDTETNTMDQPNTSATNDSASLNDSNSAANHTSVTSSSLSILPPTSLLNSNNYSSIIQPTSNTTPAVSSDDEDDCEYGDNGKSDKSLEDCRESNERADSEQQVRGSVSDYPQKMEEEQKIDVQHKNLGTNSIDVAEDDDNKQAECIPQPVKALAKCVAEVESKQNDRFIKPLCFEAAATMDDVSDTELESYLQELEDMEASPEVNVRCENVSTATIPSFNSDHKHMGSTNECDVDELASSHSDTDDNDDNDTEDIENQINVKDDRNADSFSQASTVEFADINADSDTHLSMAIDKNDKISDFDDHERIAETDTSHEFDRRDSDVCTVPEPVDERENNSEEAVAAGQVEVQSITSAPKRPSTLELPSCFTETGRTMEVGTTPGTDLPSPANQATDAASAATSCSSSEESNMMLTDTSIRSEDATHSQCDSDADIDAAVAASDSNDVAASQLASSVTSNATSMPTDSSAANITINNLGKVQPYWIPDNMTMFCMQCNQKFSFIKRRHHCRACGQVLCSTCCSLKAKLEYMGDVEARICVQCDILLSNREVEQDYAASGIGIDVASAIDANTMFGSNADNAARSPNPNNPMEYCSVIPPHQQVASASTATPISVMVPVGVLKREGAPPKTARKEVMFSDGIRPGCDLAELDNSWTPTRSSSSDGNGNVRKSTNRRIQTPPGDSPTPPDAKALKKQKNNNVKLPAIDPKTNSYIPAASPAHNKANDSAAANTLDSQLPPICVSTRTEFKFLEVANNAQLIERLQTETLKFIVQRNFYVLVKIVKLACCINKTVINFTTQGMHHVGQDEIVILLEMDGSNQLPRDLFLHLNDIFRDADKGVTITELGFSMANYSPFLGSKEHGGFLFIRTTFQCLQNIIVPENPYLIGILIHRWEVPWAKILPLRLVLRLGALHRYYPSPHVSVRGRNSVYAEIAQTIINFLADFRTYSFTIATIRGMYIHMEDRRTNVLIPKNRYDQIMKALNNSSDHILALAGNFSKLADGHLVCVQNTESGCAETHAYSTQAINIQGKPRKVTGATFLVLNGALKTTSGLSGKCSIVEDGLMVQVLPKKMAAIQQALKTMKNIDIVCGPVDADESQTETVCIQWVENDAEFNIGVMSVIDRRPMDGVPSIRVHRGLDFSTANHIIRWTEVFILKSDEESAHGKDPIDMSKLSEQIARSASIALVTFLDLLAANGLVKLAIRTTLDPDQVCYEAGSNYEKLAPLYMNALDNELIPTLHRQATSLQLEQSIIIELVFHILDV